MAMMPTIAMVSWVRLVTIAPLPPNYKRLYTRSRFLTGSNLFKQSLYKLDNLSNQLNNMENNMVLWHC